MKPSSHPSSRMWSALRSIHMDKEGFQQPPNQHKKSHNSSYNNFLFQLLLCCVPHGSPILLFHNFATKNPILCC